MERFGIPFLFFTHYQHVIFGKVLKGHDIVREMEHQETVSDRPIKPVIIADCGELKEGEDDGIAVPDDGDELPGYPRMRFPLLFLCLWSIFALTRLTIRG